MEVTEEQLEVLRTCSHTVVNCCTSESEPEEANSTEGTAQAGDAMLAILQRGLSSISTHAKAYMDTCKTDENRKNMQSRLENSMLGLLKSEQVVKELPLLVTQVVDKFVDDMEDDEVDSKDEFLAGPCFKPLLQLNATKMGDMSRQLFQIFDQRVKEFESSLTDEKLKALPTFTALEEQVAEAAKEASANETAMVIGGGDAPDIDFSNLEIKYHDPDELSDDELMLPTIDPISKEPMMNPVRNKHCNHVFEEQSIAQYIRNTMEPRCPLDYCRNQRSLQTEDFVKVPKLTEQVRRKNMKGKQCELQGQNNNSFISLI